MDEIINGIKKWLRYFSIGCFVMVVFGLSGWGILMIVGYSYLDHLYSTRDEYIPNYPVQNTPNPNIVAHYNNSNTTEVGKLPSNQVTHSRTTNRRRNNRH